MSYDIDALIDHPERVRPFAGIRNFRDIGGYPTVDGGTVRWGMVYRAAKLRDLSDADMAQLDGLAIQAVVDLRCDEEREVEPSEWSCGAHVYVSPKSNVSGLRQMVQEAGDSVDAARDIMVGYYAKRADLFADEYAAMFQLLADGRTPMLVHCTAGKDRTGAGIALLLAALGVPRDVIVADYALTSRHLPMPTRPAALPFGGRQTPESPYHSLPTDVRTALWNASPVYIEATLDGVERNHGSIDAYLRAIGLNGEAIVALKGRLIDY